MGKKPINVTQFLMAIALFTALFLLVMGFVKFLDWLNNKNQHPDIIYETDDGGKIVVENGSVEHVTKQQIDAALHPKKKSNAKKND